VLLMLALLGLAADAAAAGSAADTGGSAMTVQTTALENVSMRVHSIKELKLQRAFRRTWHQRYDFSCGSAALATLLTYQYDQPTDETSVFQAMFLEGDQAQIRTKGFSMLDMKRYLEKRGYVADGVRASLDLLATVGIPAIALIADHGYRHFVVIKGLDEDRVLIGDPALGTRVLKRGDFDRAHVGDLFFVIRSQRERAHFNALSDWNYRLKAPLASAIDRSPLGIELLTVPNASLF